MMSTIMGNDSAQTAAVGGNGKAATALLVIDVQVAVITGEEPAYRAEATLATIADVIARARAARVPVVYIQHEHATWPELRPGAAGWQIHPAVAPRPGEPIIPKRASDAFYGTPLRHELDARGITHVVITGCDTDLCVDTTARRALSLDFDVTLVADGHTTFEREGGLTAARVIAHHNAVLANLPHPTREITVVPAAKVEF